MFKKLFLEALKRPQNLLASRKFKGSTGMGRKRQNLLPQMYKTDPNYPDKLTRLKSMDSGSFLLTGSEVETIKSLYNITDLEQRITRNLGNTGITIFINDNNYYIKK
jgi:hypothetical protein